MKAIIFGIAALVALPSAAQAAVTVGQIETGFEPQSAFDKPGSFVEHAALWTKASAARAPGSASEALSTAYAGDRVLPPPTKANLPATADDPAPMPEPGIWAMFLLGFGTVGLVMRRRRVNVAFS